MIIATNIVLRMMVLSFVWTHTLLYFKMKIHSEIQIFKIVKHQPLHHLSGFKSPPPHSSQIETVDDAGADECQDDVRFPRSFFSFFKDKSNFPLSAASQYCVDKFSALQGYLSVNPQFNVEIFHNAGINKCCERAPPLLIVVFKKREKRRTKNFYVLFQN